MPVTLTGVRAVHATARGSLAVLNLLLASVLLLALPLRAVSALWGLALDLTARVPGAARLGAAAVAPLQALGRHVLRDPRDWPVLAVACRSAPLVLGSMALQLAQPAFSWWLVGLHLLLLVGPWEFRWYSQVFICRHVEGHSVRGLFLPRYAVLNRLFEWGLGPVYGHLPEVNRSGHVAIHHAEDNGYADNQSTLVYDQSSLRDFYHYILHAAFWQNSGIGVLLYFRRRGKHRLARRMALGMVAFYGLCAAALAWDWRFGLGYLVLPFLLGNAINAFVNWTWHGFRDPAAPEDVWRNSITVVDAKRDFLNEGYHLSHHLHMSRHWSEHPRSYAENRDLYRDHGCLVLQGVHLLEIFFYITVLKRPELLARHVVDLTGRVTQDEIVALLRTRCGACPRVTTLSEARPDAASLSTA
jgi:fatty acid desaturase